MHVWQLHQAKAKLTQLIKEAKLEPQIISKHGVYETVVMSMEKYAELSGHAQSIVSFFRNSPLRDLDVTFDRD